MNNLPSQFQRGDIVNVIFPNNGILTECRVVKVSFSEHGTPRYDVDVPFDYIPHFKMEEADLTAGKARLHSIKEWHLRDPLNAVTDRLLVDTGEEC